MNILVVEDQAIQAISIKNTLSQKANLHHIFIAYNYDEAMHLLSSTTFQIFILDIDLGQGDSKNGISLAKQLRSIPEYSASPILFLTSVPSEISTAVNETHCYSYLLKPYSENSLLQAISSLLDSPFLSEEPLELKDPNGIYFNVKASEIEYAEIFGRELYIYTQNETFLTNNYTIKHLCSMASDYLVQCHKSYAINPKKIVGRNHRSHIIYVGKKRSEVPIGRTYRDRFEWRNE